MKKLILTLVLVLIVAIGMTTVFAETKLTLRVDVGDAAVFYTAQLTPIPNQPELIDFYILDANASDGNWKWIGSSYTKQDGTASFTYYPGALGNYAGKAQWGNLSSNIVYFTF